jgi:hypothetical protein
LIQAELLGGGGNSISLWCIIRKRLEATRQGLPRKFAFAEHHAPQGP